MEVMEATMFTGWTHDHLRPHAVAVKVAHPLMLRAIAAAKKKNDRIDAEKLCDRLRCDFLPECYMASTPIRERRRTLTGKSSVAVARKLGIRPFGADSDLRRWGLKLAARGGKSTKKRAVVAVARKLAVLLHRLWVSAEVYEPLHNSQKVMSAVA